MKLDRIVIIDVSENIARERLKIFFAKADYLEVDSQPNLTYRRGSKTSSWFSFTPKGWGVNAAIQIEAKANQQTQIKVKLDIDTTGQAVTEGERKFWQNELDDLERSIQTGNVDIAASIEAARSSYSQNVIGIVVVFAVAIILAIATSFVADWRIACLVGLSAGLGLGIWIVHRWLKFRI